MRAREVAVSGPVAAALQARLGAPLPTGDQALDLAAWREDLLYVWSRREGALLVVHPGPGLVQTVALAEGPRHQVEGLLVNRTATWAAVWGAGGVTAVQLPRRSLREEVVVAGLALVSGGGAVQAAAWHPGSAADSHLAVLTRDAKIALYNVADGLGEVRGLALGRAGRVAAALGEVAVDMAFGPPGAAAQWPLFVLFGNCDVFCVAAAIGSEWSVEGPLEVRPAREDNYSGEGCSLAAVGGVLCLATMGGRLFHSVVLGGDSTVLHTYEQVELELGQLPSEAGSSVFSCPVRLRGDPAGSGYLASHRAGLHRVELPMVGLLQEPAGDLAGAGSVVEHLVCTRASPALPPAPVLGCCAAGPPATVLCLLADHSLTALPGGGPPPPPAPPLASAPRPAPHLPAGPAPLDAQMAAILGRAATQPLLRSAAGPDTRLPPAEALELLTGATATLRREHLARLHIAREELTAAAARLRARRQGQEAELAGLEGERELLRAAAEGLSERHEDARDRGAGLRERLEAVLARLQARVPRRSDKELAMAREVAGLEHRVAALQGGVGQLGEKERYQRCQVEAGAAGRRDLSQAQLDNFKEVLQSDSRSIADLVQQVNVAKKELGL